MLLTFLVLSFESSSIGPRFYSLAVLLAIDPVSLVGVACIRSINRFLNKGALTMCSSNLPLTFMNVTILFYELSKAMRLIIFPLTHVYGPICLPNLLTLAIFDFAHPFSFVGIPCLWTCLDWPLFSRLFFNVFNFVTENQLSFSALGFSSISKGT